MDHWIRLSTVNISAPDPSALGAFYARLLGWEVVHDDGDWVVIGLGDDYLRVSFETDVNYQRPVWPTEPGQAPMQMHLDLTVADREELEWNRSRAELLGATLLLDRTDDEDEPLYVLADPSGHPFCIFVA